MSCESQPQDQKGTVAVVKLRGLPWTAKPKDILDFLKDVKVRNGMDGIHFKMNREGKASGEAFVEVESEEDQKACLDLDREYMGSRFIEVYESSYSNMEREIGPINRGEDGCVVRLRGLPFGSTEEDIRKFLSGFKIESITIQMNEGGRQTGEAYVIFLSSSEAERSLDKHKERMGSRYIEVFRSSYEDICPMICQQPYNRRSGPYDRGGQRNYHSGSENRGYASKKGSGYERLYRGGGGPVGPGGGGGGRFSEFSPNPSYGGYGGGMTSFGGPGYGGGPPGPSGNFGFGAPPPGPSGPGGPPLQVAPQQGGIHGGPPGGHQMGFNPPSGPGGPGGPGGPVNEFGGSGPYGNGQGFHPPQNPPGQFRPDGGYLGSGSGFYGEGLGQGSGSEMVTYPPIRSTAGGYRSGNLHQVKLRGLPYSSDKDTIQKFLLPLQPTSIEIIFDNYGRHSGEALVTFSTQQEVEEAIKKDKEYMGERYIDVLATDKPPKGSRGGYRSGGYGNY